MRMEVRVRGVSEGKSIGVESPIWHLMVYNSSNHTSNMSTRWFSPLTGPHYSADVKHNWICYSLNMNWATTFYSCSIYCYPWILWHKLKHSVSSNNQFYEGSGHVLQVYKNWFTDTYVKNPSYQKGHLYKHGLTYRKCKSTLCSVGLPQAKLIFWLSKLITTVNIVLLYWLHMVTEQNWHFQHPSRGSKQCHITVIKKSFYGMCFIIKKKKSKQSPSLVTHS